MSKKLSKKLKWVIPFAVLSVTCMSVGIVSGCKKKPPVEEHTHAYEWKHDNDEHWKECPADGAEQEGTRGEHVFVAGECECGATETVVVKKYGKVTGTVKLHKLGGYETDFTDVTVDMGDEVQPVFDKTTGTFTIDEVEVDKYYSLTVSKPGYQSYAVTVQVPTEDETVTIGGQKGIVLEYQAFSVIVYDEDLHDFSNINNENPTIKVNGRGGQSLDIISSDTYEDVSLKIETKASNGGVIQGVILKFEDGKCAILNIKTDQSLIQYRPELWGMKSVFGDRWVESKAGSVTAEDKNKFNGDGVELNLVRKGGKLIAFVDGRFILETSLPDGYEDDKVQVGFYSFDVKQNAEWAIGVSETLPALESALDIYVTQPDNAGCTVTATPEKQKYAFGEEVELTVTAASGYMLSALTVNGEDKFSALNEGKLTLLADRENIEVAATFVEKEDMALNLTVKGKKLGQTTALAEGTKVSLSGISEKFTVNAEGKITADTIAKARYTISVDGYFAKDIILDENLTEVVLEYDTFYAGYHKPGSAGGGDNDNWDGYYGNPDKIDKSNVNDADPYFTVDSTDFYQYTNDKYSDVVASITVKSDMTDNCPTVGLVFEGNKAVMLRIEKKSDGNYKVQWIGSGYWLETAINGNWDFGEGEEFYNPISNTLKEKYVSTGLKLSLMRKGDTVYAFVDDVFVAKQTITGYADKQCSVVFAIAGVKGTQNIPFDISSSVTAPTASVTDKTTDTNGTVTLSTTTAEVGTDVTVKVEPNDGYIIGTVKVNGVDVTDRLSGGEYTFTLSGDTEVEATFEEIVVGSINAEVSGKKLGVTGNSLSGDTQVVLTSATAGTRQATLSTVEGKTVLKVDEIVAGKWTVQIEGYIAAEIEVAKNAEYTTAISLEYDMFKELLGWGKFNFTNQNADTPKFGITNDCAVILTKDTYAGGVMASIYLKGENMTTGEGGLVFRFVGEGMADNGETFTVVMQNTKKVQVSENKLWDKTTIAEGAKFNNLIYFIECDDDNAHRYADEHSGEYLADYANGELKLSVLRKESTFYVFLNGRFVGKQTIAEKYKNAQCEVGFITAQLGNTTDWKYWNVDITDDATDFPALTATVTNETAQEAHGTVTGIPAEAVTLGDEVTVTVTPDDRYKLAALTVNGVDVTSQISGKEYTFAVKGNTTVVATFEEITVGSIAAEITGKKLGVTGNAITAGTKVTLTAAGLDTVETQTVEKDGTIALSVAEITAATWTVTVEGYFTTELTVVKNTPYTTAIALEYDLLENLTLSWGWGDKADLSKQNDGKIQQLSGATQWVSSKDSYNTVAISASLLKDGGRQGVFIRFGDKYAMIQKEKNDKISWNGEGNLWGNGTNILRETWTEYVKPLDMDKNEYVVTLVREANRIFVFVNGDYYDTKTLADEYADVKCNVGIYCTDCPSGERTFDITEDVSEYRKGATVTVNADETQGSVEIENAGNIKVGDTVTVTVIPVSGKFVESFKVGDEQVRVNVNGETGVATYELLVTDAAMTVTATFTDTASSIESAVSYKKFGKTPDINGATVTLTNDSYSYEIVVANGKIASDSVIPGTYKVSYNGAFDKEIIIGAEKYVEAIDFEHDAVNTLTPWGKFDFSHLNDEISVIGFTNDCGEFVTKETHDTVAVSLIINKDMLTNNQGAVIRFVGNGMNDLVYVRVENSKKVQFADDSLWGSNKAEGVGWQDLIFFKRVVENEGKENEVVHEPCAKADEYMAAIEAGTLKLTLLRVGSTVHVFLGDDYIGSRTFNAKYENAKCEAGVVGTDLPKKAESAALEDYNKISFKIEDATEYQAKLPAKD